MHRLEIRAGLFCASAALLLGLSRPLPAQDAVFEIDPAATRVEFTLGAVLHTVHGTFRVKEGSVRVDSSTGKADGRIVVDAASGESGNKARDRKMHREILESQAYPEISFVPLRVTGQLHSTGETRVELQGVIKMHGVEHEFTVPMSLQLSGDQWTAAAHFVVPYAQWGLKNPSTFVLRVSDKVDIDIVARGRAR